MSVRVVLNRLFKHGNLCIRNYYKALPYSRNISQCIRSVEHNTPHVPIRNDIKNLKYRNVLHQICIEFTQQARRILITNGFDKLGSELVQKAKYRGLYGGTTMLGFIGVHFVSEGQTILSKNEELEGVLWEIRESLSKIHLNREFNSYKDSPNSVQNVSNLSFGSPIAKGSSAVVYSVKKKTDTICGYSVDDHDDFRDYPLAVKMMFNYDIQSSAAAILKAMYREIIPAGEIYNGLNLDIELNNLKMGRYLPPHPNIVQIFSVFSDFIPELEECRNLYPAALPKRIDPNGEGRNMSLFILMKRYHINLREYLQSNIISTKTSLFLFAQLLEGIVHMVKNNIAHRDLKSDNILLDLSDLAAPRLVITDFGCCLANSNLIIPYPSYDIDKGGNTALMAPEIINKRPGSFAKLNYLKSDLWSAGTIAYEIFGQANPFYGKKLLSGKYVYEDLPDLGDNVPLIIKKLIKNLLDPEPSKRVDPETAANICQLYLWAPKSWLSNKEMFPNLEQVLEWLLNIAVKLLCHPSSDPFNRQNVRRAEYFLIQNFVCRAKLWQMKIAIEWINQNNV